MNTRKSLTPLIILLLGLVGVVSVGNMLSNDLPDTPSFPRNPSATGTLGYVLGLFGADGTAPNTEKLGGRSASGYLQNTYCTDSVWNGINPDGTAHCKQPLLAFAEIYEGSMQVNGVTKPIGTILYEGDKLETNATQTGTIRFTNAPRSTGFTPDISIARIGENSTVFIDRGDTAGTLALITLEDGLLWGRVLTSTGINFGGNTVIAGVRGTSIRMWADRSTSQTRMAVIDSASSTPTGLTWKDPVTAGGVQSLEAGQRELGISSGAANTMTVSLFSELSPTNTSPLARWTQSNLRADLDYLIALKSSVSPSVQPRLNTEISSLTQSGNTAIQSTFEEMACIDIDPNATLWHSLLDQGKSRKDSCKQGVLAYADFTQVPDGVNIDGVTSLYTKNVAIYPMTEVLYTGAIFDGKNFYTSTIAGSSAFPPISKNRTWELMAIVNHLNESHFCSETMGGMICRAVQHLISPSSYASAYIKKGSEYTTPICTNGGYLCTYSNLYMRTKLVAYNQFSQGGGDFIFQEDANNRGITIKDKNYLSYPLTQLTDEIGSLAGKTIEIEFDSLPTGTTNSTFGEVILDLNDGTRVTNLNGTWKCISQYTSSSFQNCGPTSVSNTSGFKLSIDGNKLLILITKDMGAGRFVIGNSTRSAFYLKQAINKSIKTIKIR